MLNEEQESHLTWLRYNQEFGNIICATLSGPAGTGKTFTIQEIKKYMNGPVITLAPTNSAARTCGGETIHSFFLLVPLDPDAPIIEFSKTLEPRLNQIGTIILDECSMISTDMIFRIRDFCKERNIHLICVGDYYQLPPVGERQMNICFDKAYFQQLKLTQPMRQQSGSSIISLSNHFRQYNRIPDFNELKKISSSKDVIFDQYSSDWLRGWDSNTTVVGYTNDSVMSINKKIVDYHFSDGDLFHTNDRIVLKSPIWYKSGEYFDKETKETKPVFKSISIGSDVVLLSCVLTEKHVIDVDNNPHDLIGYQVSFQYENITIKRFLLHYACYNEFDRLKKSFTDAWKRGKLNEIRLRWKLSGLPSVMRAYHNYATTIHMSQGKTHEKTSMMTTSLYSLKKKNDIELYNRLAYVAITRPKQQLTLTGKIY